MKFKIALVLACLSATPALAQNLPVFPEPNGQEQSFRGYLTGYNISDLNDIVETDRVQANPGSNTIIHNR